MKFPAVFPQLRTARLRLRAYAPADAAQLQRLAGAREVAATTMNIPPIPTPTAPPETWIGTHAAKWAAHEELVFAVTLKNTGELLGSMGLVIQEDHHKAELGYWVGVPHWNQGYTSEAARAVIDYGFPARSGSTASQAHHMADNPRFGPRVMEKAGMQREGFSPGALRKDGGFRDVVFYGVLRADWPELE